jgi:hypothetical protein
MDTNPGSGSLISQLIAANVRYFGRFLFIVISDMQSPLFLPTRRRAGQQRRL